MVNQKQSSQTLHLRWSNENVLLRVNVLHRKIDAVMKTRLSIVKFYQFKFEFWLGYHAMG